MAAFCFAHIFVFTPQPCREGHGLPVDCVLRFSLPLFLMQCTCVVGLASTIFRGIAACARTRECLLFPSRKCPHNQSNRRALKASTGQSTKSASRAPLCLFLPFRLPKRERRLFGELSSRRTPANPGTRGGASLVAPQNKLQVLFMFFFFVKTD